MGNDIHRFPFIAVAPQFGAASHLPYLPFMLNHQASSLEVQGLLDTGATVNVLPYATGVELGAIWEQQTAFVKLTGNLARFDARVLIVDAIVGTFAPVRLAFAWTRADNVPLILGQVNFFLEFDVCFFRSRKFFEIQPKMRRT
jgi:hypothetical protein